MNEFQFNKIKEVLTRVSEKSNFYKEKFKGIDIKEIQSKEDFEKLPFTDKNDLRNAYPLGLQAVPNDEIVRIHSSSGTTGTPVVIPYTRQDVLDWAEMFKRCYETAGITSADNIQITPGYGLWTAGIGFQTGAELLGAMVIPMGPGNTEKQIKMMMDLKSTVLCATSSYALLLSEEITKRNLNDKISLKKGIIGSERWGEKMRNTIAKNLGIELYDIYGLTEIYGPGIAISCDEGFAMHYWDDYVYFEIVDPDTGRPVPYGEMGELVITTLRKEAAPLIRYRTHDLTRFIEGECPCGNKHPRIDTIVGRTDDMVKVKGTNIFPGQIDEILKEVDGASSEYQVVIEHVNGKDALTLSFEIEPNANIEEVEHNTKSRFKSKVGITIIPKAVPIGTLPRSEKKSTRIFDYRY